MSALRAPTTQTSLASSAPMGLRSPLFFFPRDRAIQLPARSFAHRRGCEAGHETWQRKTRAPNGAFVRGLACKRALNSFPAEVAARSHGHGALIPLQLVARQLAAGRSRLFEARRLGSRASFQAASCSARRSACSRLQPAKSQRPWAPIAQPACARAQRERRASRPRLASANRRQQKCNERAESRESEVCRECSALSCLANSPQLASASFVHILSSANS